MAGKERSFIFEIVADSILIKGETVESVPTSDLRLSIAMADLPVIHIHPRENHELTDELGMKRICFGGTGKLCEFSMSKRDLESQNLVLLLLKEVSAISDFLILTMTAPLSLRDLILSLPSSNLGDREAVPFAARTFSFIDGMGCCSVRLRLTASLRETHRKAQTETSHRLHRPIQRKSCETDNPPDVPPPPPTINQLIEAKSQEICSQNSQNLTKYGRLRQRSPLIGN